VPDDADPITLVLRVLPDSIAPEIRLRRALKFLGRSCRLKCIAISGAPAPGQSLPASTTPTKEPCDD
jgi:hypothetical protein